MAGGKETPRQKMIGMMYLVLTALLALNVSKSILDAFVAIEENIQKANLTELFRGDERKAQISETAMDKSNPLKAEKARLLKVTISEIDKMTAERIKFIDDLKLEILLTCGEDVSTIAQENAIIMEKYSIEKNPLKPIRMNLEYVQGMDKYDEPMYIMIGEDITNPVGKGMELWKSLLSYRKELTEKIASSQIGGGDNPSLDRKYFFKAPSINKFKDQKDLDSQLKKAIEQSNVHPDDVGMIQEIYKSLTKEEFSTVHDIDGVHWIGKTFDHSPSVAAIASLSSLQKDILSARANALSLIRSRVSGNDYSFNKIIPLAYGPEVVNVGDEFEVNVMMVAYDSDKQPEVSLNGESVKLVKDGKGIVHLKASGSVMELKGTISVQNKSGVKKTLPWEKTVHVMKPSGSIELPELNVLYRGYENHVNATASGYEKTELLASGASLARSGDGFIVRPTGSGRTAQLTVLGKSGDGRSIPLKKVDYRVLNLPDPTLYWGAVKNGGSIPPGDYRLFMKYGPEIPLQAQFTIVKWEISAGQAPVSGTGNNIASATALIKAIPKGTNVKVTCWVRDPANVTRVINSVFTK